MCSIRKFVKRGGKVIVLGQEKILDGFFPVSLSFARPILRDRYKHWLSTAAIPSFYGEWGHTICFLRGKGHPVLMGLEEDDLKFWGKDNVVSKKMLFKPFRGNFIPLVDSARRSQNASYSGLSCTPLLEMPYGKGSYLFSQLEITTKYREEPIAKVLLGNMINYGISASRVENKVGLFVSEYSPFFKALTEELMVDG